MKNLLLLLTISLFGLAAFAQQDKENVMSAYLRVKEALVKSDSKQTSQASAELLTAVNALKGYEDLKKATANMAAQNDLEKQRNAFAKVSAATWELVKDSKELSTPLFYQYCPMKKTYWISAEEKIRNPYYGSTMLTCGRVSDKK